MDKTCTKTIHQYRKNARLDTTYKKSSHRKSVVKELEKKVVFILFCFFKAEFMQLHDYLYRELQLNLDSPLQSADGTEC